MDDHKIMVHFSIGAGILIFSTLSKLNLGPTHPPVIMIMEVPLSGQRNAAVLLIIIGLIVFVFCSLNAHEIFQWPLQTCENSLVE